MTPNQRNAPQEQDPLGLFTDRPPHWLVNRGKSNQRHCDTIRDANSQRKSVITKLRWHGKRSASVAVLALETKLLSCKPAQPCLSGACPICIRAQQRLFVMACTTALPSPNMSARQTWQLLSLVPHFGRHPRNDLARFDMAAFKRRTRDALREAGISRYWLGVDVSLNHDAGHVDAAYWQFQLWGFFDKPPGLWRRTLTSLLNPDHTLTRPVLAKTFTSIEAAAAYAVKATFTRRVSYVKPNNTRADRGQCRNTNDRILRGNDWVSLMLFLDRSALEGRVLGKGERMPFAPLKSRRTDDADN